MLLVQRDLFGNLVAAIEWQLVDENGQLDIHGEYVWVNQVEVNPHCGTTRIFRQFIEQSAALVPTAKWAYWTRRDKLNTRRDKINRPLSCFSRNRLVTFARRDADVAVAV